VENGEGLRWWEKWSNFLLLQTPMTKLEILDQPLYGNSNIVFNGKPTPCPPSHLGTWLCEGVEHGSEAAVSGKLV
jgi:hypothetical protein